MATKNESLFTNFQIEPLNGITITGIHYLPPLSPRMPSYRPLIIFLHGATCTAHNFDISPNQTSSLAASALSIPIVSINRPDYLSSTQLPLPDGATYHETLGSFYHTHLFPILWTKFGIPANCTALVLFAHSFGSPAMIVAAGVHAQDPSPAYPLAGIIFSGWGVLRASETIPHPTSTSTTSDYAAWKRQIMFHRPEHGLVPHPSEAFALLMAQDHPAPPREREDVVTGAWDRYWRRYSDAITAPVMFAQAEFDFFWDGSETQVDEMRKCFPRATRFDGSLVRGAPHAMEWSWVAQGWYVRAFGFALEVTAVYARDMERRKEEQKEG